MTANPCEILRRAAEAAAAGQWMTAAHYARAGAELADIARLEQPRAEAEPIPAPPPDLLTIEEVAAILKVRPRTARDKIAHRPDFIRPVMVSGAKRYRRADLMDWINTGGNRRRGYSG